MHIVASLMQLFSRLRPHTHNQNGDNSASSKWAQYVFCYTILFLLFLFMIVVSLSLVSIYCCLPACIRGHKHMTSNHHHPLPPSSLNLLITTLPYRYQQHSVFLDAFPAIVDVVVLDGVSLPLPLFSWMDIPSIFYCHFPDKLLAQGNSAHDSGLHADIGGNYNPQYPHPGGNNNPQQQGQAATSPPSSPPSSLGGRLRAQYRDVLDRLEELTTGCAEVVMVNSQYVLCAMLFLLTSSCLMSVLSLSVSRSVTACLPAFSDTTA
jgi:hypothetical protein